MIPVCYKKLKILERLPVLQSVQLRHVNLTNSSSDALNKFAEESYSVIEVYNFKKEDVSISRLQLLNSYFLIYRNIKILINS